MAAQFSNNDSIESGITYEEVESNKTHQSELFEYAVMYVVTVKNTFGANGEEYRHFLALLDDYTGKRTAKPVVVSRIKLIFSEHQELIEGFNYFLPEGLKITLPLTRRPDISLQETINYVNKVKVAFLQEEERCTTFLQLITGYQESRMSLHELSEKMCELLSDRQDLLEEFFDYMPSSRESFRRVALNHIPKGENIQTKK